MKNKKGLEALTVAAKTTNFPKYNVEYHRFTNKLRELVEVNFGYNAKREMHYDDDSQTYYWEAYEVVGNLKTAYVTVKKTFTLDPAKDLLQEFERIAEEYAEFGKLRGVVARDLIAAGGVQ